MGPSTSQQCLRPFLSAKSCVAMLAIGVLSSSCLLAQANDQPSTRAVEAQAGITAITAPAGQKSSPLAPIGTISGTVLDARGAPLAGAQVVLGRNASPPVPPTSTAEDGHYSFAGVPSGPFQLSVALTGFKPTSVSGNLPETQGYLAPIVTLELAPVVTDVSVRLTTEEIAQEQIKEQEQQKLLAVIPNFYATYAANAVPMNSKQKFELAWKLVIDPSSFVIAGIIAGGQQANNSMPGYGQGAAGYGRRFGAAYGDFFIGTWVSNAILPSILKQDPRYFYKGTGTTKSRIAWALKRSVMARGDNGHWQPDYSGILGSLAAGGISNLYYPEGSRHGFETTLTNTLIGIGTGASVNILQEFVFRKVTPKAPKSNQPTS